jgi:hypothetical protein
MLTELIKHNNLGNIDNILFVLQSVLSEKPRAVGDIKKYCSDKSVDFIYAIDGILILLEFTGIISRSRNSVKLSKNISPTWIKTANNAVLSKTIIETIFLKLKDESHLDDFISLEKIKFDTTLNQLSIQNNSIPLQYSPIKNLLINLGGLKTNSEFPTILLIDKSLQSYFETVVVPWLIDERERTAFSLGKAGLSLDKFLELQELKNQYGAQAEEYVLEFEKNRLNDHLLNKLIRRISNFDVRAGYDIVSFETQDSKDFDRFIEVKSFSKYPEFYWSKNEVRTAEIKGDSYFLYLVDREQIGTANYQPIIIQNPYLTVYLNSDWQKDAQSWLVKQPDISIPIYENLGAKVFISYAHENKSFAKKLAAELEKNGYRVWWDYSTLKGGQDWQREIQSGIIECHYFIIVLTPSAVASDWVRNEITLATQKDKTIIPLFLENCEIPIAIIRKQYIEFENQTHKAALNELIELLKIQNTKSNSSR